MRGERGRRLIEQTADLLSADYPLDLPIERLCDALAALKAGDSKMYVPISCRSDVFGVVGMLRNAEDYYTPSLGAQEALAFLRLHVAGVHV